MHGSAARRSVAARRRARSKPAMPVIGFIHGASPEPTQPAAFRQGLHEAGFIEGQNVAIEAAGPKASTNDCRRLSPS